jgi:hypothetical protein
MKRKGGIVSAMNKRFGLLSKCMLFLAVSIIFMSYSVTSLAETPYVISSGSYHTLAIDAYGNVWAWGKNAHGELGINNTSDSNQPVQS